MAKTKTCFAFYVLLFITSSSLSSLCRSETSNADRKTYIVYMGEKLRDLSTTRFIHVSMLTQVLGRNASKHLRHTYHRSFNGFSAELTAQEAKSLAEMEGVVSVFESKSSKPQTTRSWDFMGFPKNVSRSTQESDIIVGVIDTGIWPESPSFSDEGFGPAPAKWKGVCQSTDDFTCNNKIIGARYYYNERAFGPTDIKSPRDTKGHGSHTASTAAGNAVEGASFQGLAEGVARGGVPSARIAVYKVCWEKDCPDDGTLKAFDDAIADGVDIISISVGKNFPTDFTDDPFSIGSFHAMKNGILTSHSAGNSGPNHETLASNAPWLFTVAASTIDRKFVTDFRLGDGTVYSGKSLNTFDLQEYYSLIRGRDAPNIQDGFDGSQSRFCENNTLDATLVNGKIVLCERGNDGEPQRVAGAAGTVMGASFDLGFFMDATWALPLPASLLDPTQLSNISDYIDSASGNPTATISKTHEEKDDLAPKVASFSSRGPNSISPNILKPDITAPGVDILAAWSPIAKVSEAPNDIREVKYHIQFGTSMACPHVSAAAAYVKSFHPTWSPAAIKSAIMTTAHPMDPEGNEDAEFAYGVGHLNPLKAINPGLIYDISEADYVDYLCSQGYSTKKLRMITGHLKQGSCNDDLNYPALVLPVYRQEIFNYTFTRTVTNFGWPPMPYRVKFYVRYPDQLKITVSPGVLKFSTFGEKLSFQVRVEGMVPQQGNPMLSGAINWDDGVHQVRSPVLVYAPF